MTETNRKRSEQVPFWVTPEGLQAIDEARGQWSRSEYIRQALRVAREHKLQGPPTGKGVQF